MVVSHSDAALAASAGVFWDVTGLGFRFSEGRHYEGMFEDTHTHIYTHTHSHTHIHTHTLSLTHIHSHKHTCM